MSTAVLMLTRMKKNVQRKVESAQVPQVNWAKFCLIGFAFCILLLIFYIYQINVLTRETYFISSYKNDINEILQANKKLEVNFAENSFLGEVLDRVQALDFEKTTSVKYIQVLDASLANAK